MYLLFYSDIHNLPGYRKYFTFEDFFKQFFSYLTVVTVCKMRNVSHFLYKDEHLRATHFNLDST